MNLVHEARMHGASDEFLKVLREDEETAAHIFAMESIYQDEWNITQASGFIQELFMGDVETARTRTLRRDEQEVLATHFGV